MAILILGRIQPSDIPVESPDYLVEALRRYGTLHIEAAHYDDLVVTMNNQTVAILLSGKDITRFDAIMFTDWFSRQRPYADTAFAVAAYAKANNIPFFNSEVLSRSQGKVSQYMLFALNHVPIPSTLFCHNIDTLLARSKAVFGLPFIVKASTASRGAYNYYVDSMQTYKKVQTTLRSLRYTTAFIAQEFLPNKGDYRFIITGGITRLIIWRHNSGVSHLNNTSAGAKASLIDIATIDPAWRSIAEQAAKLLKREVSGVDMLQPTTSNKPVVLEANNMPQLATGTFVAEKTHALHAALQELTHRKQRNTA